MGIRNDTDIEFSYPNEEDKMTTLREALKGCPKSDGVEYSEKKKKVLALVPPGGCWVDLPEDIAKNIWGNHIILVEDAEEWLAVLVGKNLV